MMKVAFYGNNLNLGYFFVRLLRQQGWQATLICPDYQYAQEQHDWWTDEAASSEWIYRIPSAPVGRFWPLTSLPLVRDLYREFEDCKVLLLAEDGPALFSELPSGPAKICVAFGADIVHYPFYLSDFLSPTRGFRFYTQNLKWAMRGDARSAYQMLRSLDRFPRELPRRAMVQRRQRRGLRQCRQIVCGPHHTPLLESIGVRREKLRFLPLPMDTSVLSEVDESLVGRLRQEFADYDLLFLHPTRHYYLREDTDVFLKDNDKLLYAFARFLRETQKRVKLLLVRKGREHDVRHSEKLVAELGIEHAVQWLPEMPNKALRSYYALPQVVVCDQYNPNLSVMGNIGREASYFGRPLITAFRPWNQLRYGEDMPEHVLSAETTEEILDAMRAVAAMTDEERAALQQAGAAWFSRNHSEKNVCGRWLDLISSCIR